jgi:HEAT repeat protein
MNTKARLITVVLAGILIGVVIVRIEQSSKPLSARLVSLDDATRVSALKIYSVKGDEARGKIVDEIVSQHLSTSTPRELQFALYALRKSGFSSPKVINPMINSLSHQDAKVREEATAGLLEIGDAAFPVLIDSLAQPSWSRDPVVNVLAKASPKVVPPLTSALADKEKPLKRRGASSAFARMNPGETLTAAKTAVPALTDAVKSPDEGVALDAAFGLHTVDPANIAPAAVFLRHVQMADWTKPEVRGWESVQAIAGIPSAAQSVPALTRAMVTAQDGFETGKGYRRTAIAGAIEKLAPRSAKVSDLTWDLKNRDASIRYRALLKIGGDPKSYQSMVASVADLVGDRDKYVAARAIWALTKIGLQYTKPIAAVLYPRYVWQLSRIDNKDIEGFWDVTGPPLGGMNEAAMPAIVDAVKSGELRLETADTVLKGSSNASYLNALMLHNKSPEVRLMAAIALARLAPKTPGLAHELETGAKRLGKVGDDVHAAQKSVQESASKK